MKIRLSNEPTWEALRCGQKISFKQSKYELTLLKTFVGIQGAIQGPPCLVIGTSTTVMDKTKTLRRCSPFMRPTILTIHILIAPCYHSGQGIIYTWPVGWDTYPPLYWIHQMFGAGARIMPRHPLYIVECFGMQSS